MLYATREKDTEQTRLARKDGKIEYTEEKITQKGNQVSFISSGCLRHAYPSAGSFLHETKIA